MSTEAWNILSPKQAEAFNILENDTEVTELFYGGAAGSGKSGLICCWQAYRRIQYPGTAGCIARKNITTITKTTLESFHEFWNLYFHKNPLGVTYTVDRKNNIINFSNGSKIFLMDLELKPSDSEYVRLGSLNITDLAIDEATECPEHGVNIIMSRVRHLCEQTKAGIPKILLCSNPANNYIKWRYVSDKEGNKVELKPHQAYIQAYLKDNPNDQFVKTYTKSLLDHTDEHTQARLLHGDWEARPENESPFFFSWDRAKHKGSNLVADTNYPLGISMDFNNNPCTAVIFQVKHGTINYLDLIEAHGGTQVLCDAIKEKYGRHYHYIVTGDASGFQRRSSSLLTDWQIVEKELQLSGRQMKLRKSNLTHIESRSLSNYMLKTNRVKFDSKNCYELIQEIERAKTKRDGTGLYKSTQRGIGYDMDGVDCFRYSTNIIAPRGKNDLDKLELERSINWPDKEDETAKPQESKPVKQVYQEPQMTRREKNQWNEDFQASMNIRKTPPKMASDFLNSLGR